MSYRLKLWTGLRYGIAKLATPLEKVQSLLDNCNFKMLSFLGVNRHIKRGWRRLPRAFGGVGLYLFAVEQMIAWTGMVLQHFGVMSILGRKFQASLEALQLELGTDGNPLDLAFADYGFLATECWWKRVWERMDHYDFQMRLDYPVLPAPRINDRLFSALYIQNSDYSFQERISLNRCRNAKELLWLSDGTTADGRYLEDRLYNLGGVEADASNYTFPKEKPSRSDWAVWKRFLDGLVGKDGVLLQPLGVWVAATARKWRWYHSTATNTLVEKLDNGEALYSEKPGQSHTRHQTVYWRNDQASWDGSYLQPASVELVSPGTVRLRGVGPAMANKSLPPQSFWDFVQGWGGSWMWEVVEGDKEDMAWLVEAAIKGTAIWTADGSYDRKRAPEVSGVGWIVCDPVSKKTLRGNFYERSSTASSYRGELLGLLALHILALAIAEYHKIEQVSGIVRCDNEGALNQSQVDRKRVRAGAKQSDILRALRSVKASGVLKFRYEWIRSHQDKTKLWRQLSLAAQLNVRCDEYAKAAVRRSLGANSASRGMDEMLPREKAAVVIGGVKLTEDPSKEIRFLLGLSEARAFYTKPKDKHGLGWTPHRFDLVDFRARDGALCGKPDGFGLWLCKQQSGFCATRRHMARLQDLLDDRCPNCLQRGKRSSRRS